MLSDCAEKWSRVKLSRTCHKNETVPYLDVCDVTPGRDEKEERDRAKVFRHPNIKDPPNGYVSGFLMFLALLFFSSSTIYLLLTAYAGFLVQNLD